MPALKLPFYWNVVYLSNSTFKRYISVGLPPTYILPVSNWPLFLLWFYASLNIP